MQSYDIRCRHAGASGLPLGGQTTYCGMYPAASASLEGRGAEDLLLVC
jgi:hypothetical protein